MSRREFTSKTKNAAYERSGGKCEARGEWYGLVANERCNMPLDRGVEYDHIDLDANSKDNSLENCAATCRKCHHFKTTKHDIPVAAKTVRQQRKARSIKPPSRGFYKPKDAKYDWRSGRYERRNG